MDFPSACALSIMAVQLVWAAQRSALLLRLNWKRQRTWTNLSAPELSSDPGQR